ncbi:MAG: hypothetical protein F4X00_01155 [Gemmatimonadetes bacterium]|nr:hypothetical protein [Gemmatimonadota bacterium]
MSTERVPETLRVPKAFRRFVGTMRELHGADGLAAVLLKYAMIGAGAAHDPKGLIQQAGELAGRMAGARVQLLTEALRGLAAESFRVKRGDVKVDIARHCDMLVVTVKGEPAFTVTPGSVLEALEGGRLEAN